MDGIYAINVTIRLVIAVILKQYLTQVGPLDLWGWTGVHCQESRLRIQTKVQFSTPAGT